MKRILMLLMVLLFSIGMIAACGQGGDSEAPGESDVEAQPDESENEGDDTEEEMEEELDEPSNEEEATEDTEEESEAEPVTEDVTLYFSDKELMNMYSEEQNIEVNVEEERPKAALEAWLAGPEHEDLSSLINEDVEVQSVEEEDGVAVVSFSPEFLESNVGSSGEQAVIDQISLIMSQFGFDETKILVDGQEQETLFGHIDATEPFTSPNPDDIEAIE